MIDEHVLYKYQYHKIYIYITLKDVDPMAAADGPSPTPKTPEEPERSDHSLAAEVFARKDTTQLEVIKGLGQVYV